MEAAIRQAWACFVTVIDYLPGWVWGTVAAGTFTAVTLVGLVTSRTRGR